MNPELGQRIQTLSDWLISEALVAEDSYVPIYSAFCDRMVEAGIPVYRVQISMRILHPMVEAVSMTWKEGVDVSIDAHAYGARNTDIWLRSPMKAMLDRGDTTVRYRLADMEAAAEAYPLLGDLLAEGATDYIGHGIMFSTSGGSFELQDGMVVSISSRAPEGFGDDHVEAINRMLPRLALVSKLASRERLIRNVLDAYLGPDAGERVRGGQISLGSGQMIDAVIWFSDLRNSTPLAEHLGHEAFLQLLNDYFSALAGSVLDNGGQVLRFIGDAALAIFPIGEGAYSGADARQQALDAAREAKRRADEINVERVARGDEPFAFGIGLHSGRIMYGNIGVPARVEFSVIGAAANEAARIESLCKSTGEIVLASEDFIDGVEGPWRDIGHQVLRGSAPKRLFALD